MSDKIFRSLPIEIRLSEDQAVPERVQLLRTCTFFHKKYGKVEITRKLLSEMVANFDKKVRRIDVMIDYSHDSEREAAGWITKLEVVDNVELGETELWAEVDWTSGGQMSLSDKEFRYLSADFDTNYEDNETPGVKHGPVLLGAGLTNRPVIKGMKPVTAIQLSELYKESSMTEEEIKAAEAKLGQINKLMEDLGVTSVEDLMAKIAEMKNQNGEMLAEKQLSEKKKETDRLFSEGKITKAQADEAIKLEKTTFDSFIKLAEMNTPIKTDEVGNAGQGNDQGAGDNNDGQDPEDKLIELAEAKAKADKIDFGTAMSIVLSENKELRKAYYEKAGTEVTLEE